MTALHNWNAWLGTDEAGKGDYFGPLVVAAVYVDATCRDTLSDVGIADGKTLSKRRIRNLAAFMRRRYQQHIVVVERMPAAYNCLYSTFRERGQNLNHLLASLHAEAIHTLAHRVGATHALVDGFSKNELITGALLQQANEKPDVAQGAAASGCVPLGIEVVQVPKAERDIAVAAASIIARDTFLTGMHTLSEKYKIHLPRGAYQVVDAGREFIALHGSDALGEVAKLHFSLTDAVRAAEPPRTADEVS